MKMIRKKVVLFLSFTVVCLAYPQDRDNRQKPVLIRADRTQEKAEEIIEHSPEKARESVEIGDFYSKRDNYKAAADRYREAIRYDAEWSEPHEKLIETLLEMNDIEGAIEACDNFINANPGSEELPEFKEKAQELRAQASAR